MSSAANHKHKPLEEAFRARMHDAEAQPSPDLWARIDHDLTVQESARYKRSMVWYRQLAAACLAILLAAGSVFFYYIRNNTTHTTQPLAATAPAQQQPASINTHTKADSPPVATATVPPAASIAVATEAYKPGKVILRKPEQKIILSEKVAAPALALGTQPASINSRLQQEVTSEESYTTPRAGAFTNSKLSTNYYTSGGIPENAATIRAERQAAFTTYTTARQMLTAMPATPAARQLLQNPEMLQSELSQRLQQLNNTATNKTARAETQPETLKIFALDNTGANDKPEKEQTPAKTGRWTVGMAYVPSYFDQNIGIPEQRASVVPASSAGFKLGATTAAADMEHSMQEAQEEFEQNTDPAFSFAVEARAGYRIGKKWKIFSGLGFTQNTARTKSSYIIKQFWLKPNTKEQEQLNTASVFLPALGDNVFTDSLSVAKTDNFYVNYRYRHLTIPAGVQFESSISKSWRWYAAGSIAANILLETSVMASNNEVKDIHYSRTDHSPFRKMQLSGNVSVGVARRISDNISVSAGPELRGYFDTLLSDTEKALAPQGRPYTIGLNMAVSYDFGGKK